MQSNLTNYNNPPSIRSRFFEEEERIRLELREGYWSFYRGGEDPTLPDGIHDDLVTEALEIEIYDRFGFSGKLVPKSESR